MNSENPPAIYTLAALRALPEWKESGRVLNLSTVEDPEFQDIVWAGKLWDPLWR